MGGEEVTLTAPNGGVIQDFTYSSSWYPQTARGRFHARGPQRHPSDFPLEFQPGLGTQRHARRHAR